MIWFLSDLHRLDHERAEIERLEAAPDTWLKNVSWRLTPGSGLELDADIKIPGGRIFPVTLKYPYAFPASPPSVFPRGVKRRWSFHQYGKGGELCLEWGADNWHADITGADLLASAHKLLSLENPSESTEDEVAVPSRDAPTIAQTLRWKNHRFIATHRLMERLASLDAGQIADITVSIGNVRTSLAVVHSMRDGGESVWRDSTVPSTALDGFEYNGVAVRLPGEIPDLAAFPTKQAFYGWLTGEGIDLAARTEGGEQRSYVLLSSPSGLPWLVWLLQGVSDSFLVFSTVGLEADSDARLPGGYPKLRGKSVCIVGCGSVGSKVATSLSRAGVQAFVLVDDDLFTSGNLVRNELDWRDMGSHKVDALARKLGLVNPQATVTQHKLRLNGQEASNRIAGALRAASSCDLIIDATANAAVFNLLAALVVADEKPLIWGEVLAGGIGGLIARYLPQRTPTPPMMRSAITQWCADKGTPWHGTDAGYDSTTQEGHPLVADDADVTVIAGHLSRMALDLLLDHDPLDYAWPAYFIGLKPGWIFNGPFDTFPLEMKADEAETQLPPTLPANRVEENATFLFGLMEKLSHETSTSA